MAKIGGYRLLGELGHGGMADVFLGVRESQPAGFTKLVVIKRLRGEMDEQHLAMFLDEARLAARLNHPNVVQTNEVGDSDGSYFMAMEYLEGQAYDRLLRKVRQGAVPHADVSDLLVYALCDALSGLQYAHELADFDGTPLAIVHRDFTPQNLFITYEGQVKVLDFGIAKAARRSQNTAEGIIKGKLRYMAPEQALALPVDRRTDLFAAGVMFYEAVSGRRLWDVATDDVGIFRALLEGTYPTRLEDGSDEVNAILAKALAREGSARYATADELRRDLQKYLRGRAALEDARERLASMMQGLFGDDRKRLRRVVETQLASAQEPSALAAVQSLRPMADLTPSTDTQRMDRVAPIEESTAATQSVSVLMTAAASPPSSQKKSLRAFWAAGVLAVLGLGGGLYAATRPSAGPGAAASTPAASAVPPAVEPVAAAAAGGALPALDDLPDADATLATPHAPTRGHGGGKKGRPVASASAPVVPVPVTPPPANPQEKGKPRKPIDKNYEQE